MCFLVLVAVSRWFLGYEARNSHDTRPLTMHALNITASLAQAVGLLNADLRGNKPQRVACGDVERTRHCCRAACDRRWMRWTLISDQSAKHRPSGCIATAGAAVFSWGDVLVVAVLVVVVVQELLGRLVEFGDVDVVAGVGYVVLAEL